MADPARRPAPGARRQNQWRSSAVAAEASRISAIAPSDSAQFQQAVLHHIAGRSGQSQLAGQRAFICHNPSMRPSEALAEHREKILSIAAARGARNVRVFGSVVHGTDRDGSDLDLLVDVDPGVSLSAYVGLQLDLEDALGVKVDVCTPDELHPQMKVRILSEALPV